MSGLAWILVVALSGALVVALVLFLALRRANARSTRTEDLVLAARRSVRAAAEEEADDADRSSSASRSRVRTPTLLSAYATEERRLSDERRGELAVRERELSERLAETLAEVERRVEERLRAWEADLERAQRALDGQVTALEQHQEQRIAAGPGPPRHRGRGARDHGRTTSARPRFASVRSSSSRRRTRSPRHSTSSRPRRRTSAASWRTSPIACASASRP